MPPSLGFDCRIVWRNPEMLRTWRGASGVSRTIPELDNAACINKCTELCMHGRAEMTSCTHAMHMQKRLLSADHVLRSKSVQCDGMQGHPRVHCKGVRTHPVLQTCTRAAVRTHQISITEVPNNPPLADKTKPQSKVSR